MEMKIGPRYPQRRKRIIAHKAGQLSGETHPMLSWLKTSQHVKSKVKNISAEFTALVNLKTKCLKRKTRWTGLWESRYALLLSFCPTKNEGGPYWCKFADVWFWNVHPRKIIISNAYLHRAPQKTQTKIHWIHCNGWAHEHEKQKDGGIAVFAFVVPSMSLSICQSVLNLLTYS